MNGNSILKYTDRTPDKIKMLVKKNKLLFILINILRININKTLN